MTLIEIMRRPAVMRKSDRRLREEMDRIRRMREARWTSMLIGPRETTLLVRSGGGHGA